MSYLKPHPRPVYSGNCACWLRPLPQPAQRNTIPPGPPAPPNGWPGC